MADLNLSPKDIVNKEFQTKWHGYDPSEVDDFLDLVIKDYESSRKEIEDLKAEIASLKQAPQVEKQAPETVTVEPVVPTYHVETPSASVTNFDILKRLSNLEREVFGKKLQEEVEETVEIQPEVVSYSDEENDLEKTKQF